MKIKNNLNNQVLQIDDLLKNDVHLGCHKTLWNPQMAPFIYGLRHEQHVFDLNKTILFLRKALFFLDEVLKEQGQVLFVGHPVGYKKSFEKILDEKNIPYIDNKSAVGGLLTNWDIHFNYRQDFLKRKGVESNHRLAKRFQKAFGNLKQLTSKPDLIIFFDINGNNGLLREAIQMNIPVISFLDTKDSPLNIDYPVPANNKSHKAGKLYLDLFSHIINKV